MVSLAVEKFDIELEHDIDEEYQYQPGELLRGDVVLRLRTPIDLHSICVRVRGQSTVSWEDNVGVMHDETQPTGNVEPIKRRHQSSETYIDVEEDVLRLSSASGASAESKTLGPGEHRFHLEFLLPSTLPSSFIGKFGCVTYVVMATLRRSKSSTVTHLITSEPFLVLRPSRLADHPDLLKPTEAVIERRLFPGGGGTAGRALCCCCVLCGREIQIRFLLQKTGFLPDEDMVIEVEMTNRTSLTIDAFEAALVLRSCFRAMSSVREHVQVIARERYVCLPGVEPKPIGRLQSVHLAIPPYVPESHLEGCDIIDIDYQVHLLVNLSDHVQLETSVLITVVTVDDRCPASNDRSIGEDNSSFYVQIPPSTTEANFDDVIRNNGFMDEIVVHHFSSVDVIRDADDALERFRHPMEPGETRRNIIFDNNEEELCSTFF